MDETVSSGVLDLLSTRCLQDTQKEKNIATVIALAHVLLTDRAYSELFKRQPFAVPNMAILSLIEKARLVSLLPGVFHH